VEKTEMLNDVKWLLLILIWDTLKNRLPIG